LSGSIVWAVIQYTSRGMVSEEWSSLEAILLS
jgi:hypothetical protein